MTKRLRMAALTLVLGVAMLGVVDPSPAGAQQELQESPKTLVIAYRAEASNRAAFRSFMESEHAAMLRKLKAEGTIKSFRIFFSWYPQPKVWDAMVELRFPSDEKMLEWNRLERKMPGGLSAKGLALASPVLTSSADIVFRGGGEDRAAASGSTYYVVPYQFANASEYRAYAKAYVIPQYEGWMKSGSLSGYEVLFNRYPVGDPWDSLVVLQYRDPIAFGKRQHILDEVRKGLVTNPEWQAYHKRKGEIRSETENSIADLIAD